MDLLTADAAGWMASALTACCFACTRMLRLRALALLANLAFIAYGSLAGLAPVLVLHLMLAPLNAWHLWRQWGAARSGEAPLHGAAQPRHLPPAFIGPLDPQPLARRRPLRAQPAGRVVRSGIGQAASRPLQATSLRRP